MSTVVNTGQAEAWNGPVGQHWANHHERYDGMLASFDEALFTAAGIEEADRVLDVGCGSGSTTRRAARLAGRGHAVGVDISEPMLARARSLSTGIGNVSYEWGDAQVHPFPADGHDVAISRGGVMFFADHTAAFTNIGRSLRPGGRLAFVCPRPAAPDGEEGRALGLLASLLAASATRPSAAGTSAPGRLRGRTSPPPWPPCPPPTGPGRCWRGPGSGRSASRRSTRPPAGGGTPATPWTSTSHAARAPRSPKRR